MWTRSQKSMKQAQLCKIEEEPELDTKGNSYNVQTFNNSIVDSSQIQLMDFVSDIPVNNMSPPTKKGKAMTIAEIVEEK